MPTDRLSSQTVPGAAGSPSSATHQPSPTTLQPYQDGAPQVWYGSNRGVWKERRNCTLSP